MAAHLFFELLLATTAFASPFNLDRRANTARDAAPFPRALISKYQTGPGFVPVGQKLDAQLSQQQTNGKSVLGTFDAPTLPSYASQGGVSPGDLGIGDIPNTGVTRNYDFYITEQNIAPDGVLRPGMVVSIQHSHIHLQHRTSPNLETR